MRLTPIPKHGTEIYRLQGPDVTTEMSQWSHLIRSLKSSGIIMEKRVCLTKPLKKYPEGRLFSWSWKQIARLKPSDFPDYVEKWIAKGWVLLKGQRKLNKSKKDSAVVCDSAEVKAQARTRPTRGAGARVLEFTAAEAAKVTKSRKPRRLRVK